jgi:hypothetical protein
MKMENKYYTPELEEFHRGFEYEAYHNHDWWFLEEPVKWKKTSFDEFHAPHMAPPSVLKKAISNGWVRVKYLDREDIESLGFKSIGQSVFKSKIRNERDGDFRDIHIIKRSHILIATGDAETPYTDWDTVFVGTIKNKSELKKVLKMIGYV